MNSVLQKSNTNPMPPKTNAASSSKEDALCAEKVRVLHSLAALGSGGVDLLLYNYYKCMDHSKIAFDFIVHVPDKGMVERQLENMDSRVYHLARFRHGFTNFFRTRRIIKDGKYTIVHAHHTRKSFLQLLAAWSCGVKVRIAHSHDFRIDRGLRGVLLKISSKLTTLMATDYFSCGDLAGQYVFPEKVHSPRYRLVRNAVKVDDFRFSPSKRQEMRARHGLENAFVVLHVGRFADQKNHRRLIEIFDSIQKRKPNARLLLIGEGELENDIRRQVENSGLNEKVLFVGKTMEVSAFMQAADVFLLPSFHEGFPIVLVEAQAAGLPCVASASITREANLIDLVAFVPLEDTDEKWSETVCGIGSTNRAAAADALRDAGYDLPAEAQKLQQWYLSRTGRPE